MRDRIDDGLNEIFGKRNNYTEEEIERAQARKKKYGGTLLDNLIAVTGRTVTAVRTPDLGAMLENAGIDITAPALDSSLETFRRELQSENWGSPAGSTVSYPSQQSASAASRELERGNENAGPGPVADRKPAEKAVEYPEASVEQVLGKFSGVTEEMTSKIYGQDKFISSLVIAFKRPVVMPSSGDGPRNTIFISGAKSTGRHTALKEIVSELGSRGVLHSSEISVMDLSLYPGPDAEKLFLQDLYAALVDEAEVVLFENFEACHSSFLTLIAQLVMKGECRLSSRYVLQNGQLVGITNSLASESVGSLRANGKYLVFISEKSEGRLADCFGAPFVNAVGDICRSEKPDQETFRKVSERELEKLKKTASEKLLYRLEAEEEFVSFCARKAEKQKGIAGILDYYVLIYKALATTRLEQDRPLGCSVKLTAEEGTVMAEFPLKEQDGKSAAETLEKPASGEVPAKAEEKSNDGKSTEKAGENGGAGSEKLDLLALLGSGYSGELEAVKAELASIVGLKDIKEYILGLENYYRMQQRRKEEGLKAGEVSKHMIFTGNPGTGKTTIARIISRYLKAIGVLTGGQLVEVSRADLVGRYVGHTAPLVNSVIESALGGVLFIDEAYSLYRGKDDSFGLEAIDTLVKGIEDNRDRLVVILAGYSNEMSEFLTANSGLKSRFPNLIEFPDYSGEELLEIAKINARNKGYTVDETAFEALQGYFEKVQATRAGDAGNGRLARNKVEEAILNQSHRLVAEPDANLSLLIREDFELEE